MTTINHRYTHIVTAVAEAMIGHLDAAFSEDGLIDLGVVGLLQGALADMSPDGTFIITSRDGPTLGRDDLASAITVQLTHDLAPPIRIWHINQGERRLVLVDETGRD